MKSRGWLISAIVAIAVLSYGIWRLFIHVTHVEPTLITPRMNAQDAISPPFTTRIHRALHEPEDYNRTDRPKLIALTFDDGPYPMTTPLLLDEL
ncbi:MAG: hypothetical protein ACXVAS_08360 [Vulcanimicrobiaceae bacterium]